MKRQANAQELLEESASLLRGIRDACTKAQTTESIVVLARPKVKSCLEHLRSSLDYIGHDLSETTNPNKRPKKLYFPYGSNQKLFLESLERNLPGLDPKYLPIIESLQPHVCGDDWLVRLCHVTNFNKHVSLQEQERKNSPESSTKLGNLIHMEGGTVEIGNLIIDGVRANPKGPLILNSSRTVAEIQSNLSLPIPVSRKYKWVKFVLTGSQIDVAELLERSHHEISQFTANIYSI